MKYLQDDDLARWTAELSSELPVGGGGGGSSSSMDSNGGFDTNGGGGGGGPPPNSGSMAGGFGGRSSSRRRLHGRLEAYSMKRAGNDKQYAQSLGKKFVEQIHQDQQLLAVLKSQAASSSSSKENTTNKKQSQGRRPKLQRRRSQSTGNLMGLDDDDDDDPQAPLKRSSAARAVSREHNDDDAVKREEAVEDGQEGSDASPSPSCKKRTRAVSFDTGSTPIRRRRHKVLKSKSSSRDQLVAAAQLSSNLTRNQTALGDFTEQATRRLMTDLILTLNASFPDYDFSSTSPSDFQAVSVPAAVRRINERLAEWSAGSTTMSGGSCSASCGGGSGMSSDRNSQRIHNLWTAIDKSIRLTECQVYLFQPTDGTAGNDATLLEDAWMEDDEDDEDDDNDDYEHDDEVTNMVVANDSDEDRNHHHHPTRLSSARSSPPIALWSFYYLFVNKNLKRILLFSCVETMKRQCPYAASSYGSSGGGNDVGLQGDEDYYDDNGGGGGTYYYPSSDATDTQDYIDLDPEAPTAGGIPVSSV